MGHASTIKPLPLQQVIKMAYQLHIYEEVEDGLHDIGIERQPTIDRALISVRSWVTMGYRVTIRELEPSIYDN